MKKIFLTLFITLSLYTNDRPPISSDPNRNLLNGLERLLNQISETFNRIPDEDLKRLLDMFLSQTNIRVAFEINAATIRAIERNNHNNNTENSITPSSRTSSPSG